MAAPVAAAPPPGSGLTAPGRPLAAFRHRDFRVLLLSTLALQVGSWVQTIGMGWLVLHDLDGNATSLGVVALLRGASLLLLSPVGGFLSGRFERRRQLVVYTSASASIAALLAVLITFGAIELWMVYVTAILAGAVEALAGPIRMLLVYDSVGGEDLTNAVALNSLGGNAMRVIGPAIGATLISLVGTEGAFQMQAACLVLAAILTWRLRPSPPEAQEATGMWRAIAAGLAYVVRDRRMAVIVFMALIPSIVVYPYVTFLPVFARDVLDSDQTGYGMLAAAVGLGSLAGGAVVAVTSNRARLGPGMMWSCLFYCAAVLLFAFMRELWLAVGVLAVAGVFHSVYAALNSSLMQLKADPEFRGQVMSLQSMTWGTTPFAALLMGRMIDHWGAPHVVAAWMTVALLMTLVTLVLSREMRRV
ncbi:MAG: MFS transporter [Dehalococcoidia bacterium]|nr:MFS transporter [Dehalococcoidia bacterium]